MFSRQERLLAREEEVGDQQIRANGLNVCQSCKGKLW